VIDDSGAPFRLKDLRLYVHSFKTRALGLVTYTVNGEMYFYCVSHNKCLNPDQVNALKHEFMAELQHQAMPTDDDPARVSQAAVANRSHAFDRFSVSPLDWYQNSSMSYTDDGRTLPLAE
jgi:hypothetical protein